MTMLQFQIVSGLDVKLLAIWQGTRSQPEVCRRRTNVQQLTCNIDLSVSFYFISSRLFSLS